ncbi:DUF262 domain-containing protein [Flavobacterium covae]|uniref:DUF262 domain-containing protein n=1 Tax=Flavobacterium covae TaxID=2906076 RepID=UPI0033929F4E
MTEEQKIISRCFKDIFDTNVRYEIPFFQRGYAWEKKQWDKLWDDIYEEILPALENNNFEDEEHFFGPVVVLEKSNAPHPNLKRYLIIDGQQRITTIYLLLGLIRKSLNNLSHLSSEAQNYCAEIDKLLSNNVNGGDDYLKLKVFSSKGDRYPTYKIVFLENPSSPYLVEDQKLYFPDTNRIDQFVKFYDKRTKTYNVQDLWQLFQVITKSLTIVWIPLDEKKDDAQAIFESLNDAGMPLTASELLCNYIFKPILNDSTNEHEKLHNDFWLKARKEVGEGNFEDYLINLFSIGEKKRIGQGRRMYVHFKNRNKKITKDKAVATLNDILENAKYYNNIKQPLKFPHKDGRIKSLLYNISQTNMTSITPFLMSVLKSYELNNLSDTDTIDLLQETYVLLVRSKFGNRRVTKFDTFFPSLLNDIINEPDKSRAIEKKFQSEGLWVSNQEFEDAFLTKELYNQRELNFARHILQELDKYLQEFKEYPDYSTINTIEHILPQNLNEHWATYLKDDAENPNLKVVINTVGNLLLNSSPANSTFGQKPFAEKINLYTEVSALSRKLKESNLPKWDIEEINNRSKKLSENGLAIWKWKSQ